jgi:hypothetical protein
MVDALCQERIVSTRYSLSSRAYPDVHFASDGQEVNDVCDEPITTTDVQQRG